MNQDFLDLRRDLLVAAGTVTTKSVPIMQRAGVGIKTAQAALAAAATPKGFARHYPKSIGYDLNVEPERIGLEVGPDKAKVQGALGNLLVFGSRNNRPTYDDTISLAAEVPEVEKHIADLAERLLS